ncbi:hypothetical protein ACFPOE_19340 [Caenimonas terrae]|uniref:Uncharacterized protein n=1 Tax=Caenimonas terrae TaxID=696074 RepID=A0ABW0NI74_9BURK
MGRGPSETSTGVSINVPTGRAETAAGNSFAAWKDSHRGLRALERALVAAIHSGGARMESQHALAAQIAALRSETQSLFEDASRQEQGSLRGPGRAQ